MAAAHFTNAPSSQTRKMTFLNPVRLAPPISRHALSIAIMKRGMSPDQSGETWSRL